MTARAVVIGNGSVPEGLGPRIDAADCVIRFNEPRGTAERIGTRTDLLFLLNSGTSAQARSAGADLLASPFVAAANRLILPLHPSIIRAYHPHPNWLSRLKGRQADWTAALIAVLGREKEISVLPAGFYESACHELGISAAKKREWFPSTGFLGLLYAIEHYRPPEWRVEFAGFGFTGWKRHDWPAERAWVNRALAKGRLHTLGAE